MVAVPEYAGVEMIIANDYAGAELLLSAPEDDQSGFGVDTFVWWATPLCTPTPSAWWETVQIQDVPGYYPAGTRPKMALDAAGYPSFFLWQSSGGQIQTTY